MGSCDSQKSPGSTFRGLLFTLQCLLPFIWLLYDKSYLARFVEIFGKKTYGQLRQIVECVNMNDSSDQTTFCRIESGDTLLSAKA